MGEYNSGSNFIGKEVTFKLCCEHLVFYQPEWWPKTTLSFIAVKHYVEALKEQV